MRSVGHAHRVDACFAVLGTRVAGDAAAPARLLAVDRGAEPAVTGPLAVRAADVALSSASPAAGSGSIADTGVSKRKRSRRAASEQKDQQSARVSHGRERSRAAR